MSDLKQLRSRVKSIKSTQKITKAMQIVSATKLAKIKNQINDSGYYIDTLRNMMSDLVSENNLQDLSSDEQKFFSKELLARPALLVVITSERGLCGAFNLSVIKQVKSDIRNLENENKDIKLIIVGKKGYDALKNQYSHYINSYFNLSKSHDDSLLLQVKEKIMQLIENSEAGMCRVYFNKFKNAMTQILIKQQMLPVERDTTSNITTYEYEGEGLVFNMINLYISGQLNYALLQSRASEEGARMTAMDNATNNAKEIINKLTLKLNRTRQAIITKELTEIISGAESI